MWARIEAVSGDSSEAWLPADLAQSCSEVTSLAFGLRQAKVSIRSDSRVVGTRGSSFKKPIRVLVTERVLQDLLIRRGVVYRVHLSEDRIELGPLIGILLGHQTHRYSPRHMEKYSDRLGVYSRIGGIVCAFSSETVDWGRKTAYGLIYNVDRTSWEYAQFPLPSVAYRRSFHSRPADIDRLRHVGVRVFNSRRFLKPEVYDIIRENKALRKYIPPTQLVSSYDQLKSFIDANERVILKPTDLSRGRGICFVDKRGHMYTVTDYREPIPVETPVDGDGELRSFFMKNKSFFTRYLAQRLLPLARVGGQLFDIRVVMHKSPRGVWKCSGIECRVGGPGMLVTNISRGGMAMPLEAALDEFLGAGDHTKTVREVHTVSSRVCAAMDETGEHFAELGLDLALDTDGKLWLIEVNVIPSFKGFKEMDPPAYLRIRQAPLLYASAVAGFSPVGGANDKVIPGETGARPGPVDHPQCRT